MFHIFSAELSKNYVHQTPADTMKNLHEGVLMTCNHYNSNFNMIQWYKQSAGRRDMVRVGSVRFSSPEVEDAFKDIYEVKGNGGSQSSLHILKLNGSEDRAVYFCAASDAQWRTEPSSFNKNLHHNSSSSDNEERRRQWSSSRPARRVKFIEHPWGCSVSPHITWCVF